MSPLTGVLTEAWDLYRRFASHFLLISFVIYVITAAVVALLSLAGVGGAIVGAIISFAAIYVVQASLIKAVQDVRDGRVDLDLGQTVQAAGPLIVPGLILLTYWCLIVPFIVIGGAGVFDSFGHSMRTVRGYAWRVFGTYVLVFLILIAFAIVLGFVLILLPLWLRSFVNNVVTGTLIAPFLALVATLIYYRLTAAHANEPYTPTGPAGATVAEPPYPTMTPSAADSPGPPPGPAAPGPASHPAGPRPRHATTARHPLTPRIGAPGLAGWPAELPGWPAELPGWPAGVSGLKVAGVFLVALDDAGVGAE